jgi:uncharacterized protein (TIGR03435 family)
MWIGFALASAQTPHPPEFEVASIRQHVFAGKPNECRGQPVSGNRVTIPCSSLRNLILRAYDVRTYQITGGPAWLADLADLAYDINARAPGEDKPTARQIREMLQSLLADRFQLQLHHESKELPVYALVTGKNGPRLKESASDVKPGFRFLMGGLKGNVTATGESMAQFAGYLSNEAGRPVIDKTGLTGSYDFTLEWMRDQTQVIPGLSPAGSDSGDGIGPSLFTALQEQLGLRMESQKSPIDVLVIDRAARPSEN